MGVSAVRTATLAHAQRARTKLQAEYDQPFRGRPAVVAAHVIAEADGTMIGTVASGPRKGKRPREWKQMKLVAAQAKDSTTTVYGATFGSVEETGQRWGHCTQQAGWGLNRRIHAVGDGADWSRLQSQEIFGPRLHKVWRGRSRCKIPRLAWGKRVILRRSGSRPRLDSGRWFFRCGGINSVRGQRLSFAGGSSLETAQQRGNACPDANVQPRRTRDAE